MLMTQVLADAYGCLPAIEDEDALLAAAGAAVAAVGAKIIGQSVVRYVPHGLTVSLFLAESHVVLTTWPEHRLLLIDLLLCNPDMNPHVAIDAIVAALCPDGEVVRHEVVRIIDTRPYSPPTPKAG